MAAAHEATVEWVRGGRAFGTDYDRSHTWSFDSGTVVPASSAPHLSGDPSRVDPEEALVAAISSCHMLWFLYLAAEEGLVVESYRDRAVGHMRRTEPGRSWITDVRLRPAVTWGGHEPAAELVEALHDESHRRCFVANSVRSEITVEPAPPGPAPAPSDAVAGAGGTDPSSTGPSWSDIAEWYDALVVAGSGPHETALACLLDLAPSLAGARVLDLACGQGLASRALHAAGADAVVGVDASEAMVALARGHGETAGLGYVVDDAQVLGTQADASFDGVTCQLGLMDIPDLDATLAAVHRVLRPGGWFAFVIGHPAFLAPDARHATRADGTPVVEVGDYLGERFWRSSNPHGVRRAGNHHRTIATYLNALGAAGFALEHVAEPTASPLLVAQQPVYAKVPIFLAARVRRR